MRTNDDHRPSGTYRAGNVNGGGQGRCRKTIGLLVGLTTANPSWPTKISIATEQTKDTLRWCLPVSFHPIPNGDLSVRHLTNRIRSLVRTNMNQYIEDDIRTLQIQIPSTRAVLRASSPSSDQVCVSRKCNNKLRIHHTCNVYPLAANMFGLTGHFTK